MGLGGLIGAGIQIAAFRIGPIVIAKEAGLEGAAFIIADAAIRLFLLLGMLLLLSLFRPFRKILKYHGAEHKAIAAFEAGKPLTASAAAGFSRFHPRCGTSFLVVSAVVSIAIYGAVLAITGVFTYPALIATRLIGAPIVTAVAFEIQRQAARHADGPMRFLSWPGMWAQRLTTAPADERRARGRLRGPRGRPGGERARRGEVARAGPRGPRPRRGHQPLAPLLAQTSAVPTGPGHAWLMDAPGTRGVRSSSTRTEETTMSTRHDNDTPWTTTARIIGPETYSETDHHPVAGPPGRHGGA